VRTPVEAESNLNQTHDYFLGAYAIPTGPNPHPANTEPWDNPI